MSPPPPVRAVLFDLDGTLLDTAPDMVGALNELRLEEGLAALEFAPLRRYVSHGSYALVRVGFDAPAEPHFEQLRLRFLALYRARLARETRLFPGGGPMLDELDARALPWSIVTNKPGWLTDPLLAELGLAARARCVVSGDSFPERKPHPRPLLHAAAAMGAAPGACVYVGDAARDVEAARAAGMPAIVANFGYFSPEDDPASWPADAWIDAPGELIEWLERRRG